MVRPSKVGVVVSQGKMDKTVKVRIRNVNWNRHVSKNIVSYRNMLVHDELNRCREGDVVRIQYVRPLSAKKSWAVAEFMRLQGTSWEQYQHEIPDEVKRDEIERLRAFEDLRAIRSKTQGVAPEVLRAQTGEADASSIVLDLDTKAERISRVSEQIDQLSFLSAEARRIHEQEPELAAEILRASGKKNALEANPSVQRNLIRRHLQETHSQTK